MSKVKNVKSILATATLRQSTLTSVSTAINGGLGAVFYFLLAMVLGATDYGFFTLFTTSVATLIGVVDLGCDQALVRFVPKYRHEPLVQNQIIKLILSIKIFSGIIVFLVLTLFANLISDKVFLKPEFASVLPIVGLGVISQLLFSFVTTLSQAKEKFVLWGGLFIGTNALRLLVLLVLSQGSVVTALPMIVLYISTPFVGFVLGGLFLDKGFLRSKQIFSQITKIFGFNLWVVAFVAVSTVSSRVDVFLTGRLLPEASLGVYGLALQISSVLPQLTSALGAVTAPKFASFTRGKQNEVYTGKASLLAAFLGIVGGVILVPLAIYLFQTSGAEYAKGFVPFIVLLSAMIIFIITSPVRDSIIYYFGKPQFFFWMGLGHLAVVYFLSTLLIPSYEILGSSLVVLLGQVFIVVTSLSYYWYLNRSNV